MSERKHRLIDCNPEWVENYFGAGRVDAIVFNCPEGHSDCKHVIPFSPALDGTTHPMERGRGWQRTGDTFETLTLSPSILCNASRPEAECHLHIVVRDGAIEFCGDSR
jgi:hypothetical protein